MKNVFQVWGRMWISSNANADQPLMSFDSRDEAVAAASVAPTCVGHLKFNWMGHILTNQNLFIVEAIAFDYPTPKPHKYRITIETTFEVEYFSDAEAYLRAKDEYDYYQNNTGYTLYYGPKIEKFINGQWTEITQL